MNTLSRILLAGCLAWAAACSGSGGGAKDEAATAPDVPGDIADVAAPEGDAAADVPPDAPAEVSHDVPAGPDAPPDPDVQSDPGVSADPGLDVPSDTASIDALEDAPADATPDTTGDVADDLPTDAAPDATGDVPADSASDPGLDAALDVPPEVLLPPTGDRTVSGRAYFFDAQGVGQIQVLDHVEGAEVYVLEYPGLRQAVATDGTFTFTGLPSGIEVTLALVHETFFPSLTATLTIGDADLSGVTFQAVSLPIAAYMGYVLGYDPFDPTRCSMATTVAKIGPYQDSVWAQGEPGATVVLDPPVPAANGPWYFDEQTIPDKSLAATTADGGAIAAGVEPGTYLWTAQKEGVAFGTRKLKCVGGWLTNASPPYALQAMPPPPDDR